MTAANRIIQSVCVVLVLASVTQTMALADSRESNFWVNPVIKDYGHIHPLPGAALTPEKDKTYKVVFNATDGKETDGVNAALWHVARAVNVFGEAGVEKEHRDFAVVIHGPATPIIMNSEAYKAKMGKDNPNLKLIKELKQAGVKLYVCGQAVADNKIDYKDVNPDITVTLSALADLPVLESKGYALFPL